MIRTAPLSPLLFLPGLWHGSWCWSEVVAHLAGAGRPAVAVDMAGHGLHARREPRWFTRRSYDPEAVATEVSPVADVGLDDAAELLTAQLRLVGGGAPVTVVAHSTAGLVLTRVAQESPRLIARAVYLTAFMPASDVLPATYNEIPEAAGNRIGPLFTGDPAVTGALRLDLATEDPGYREALREALYGGVAPDLAHAAVGLLTPDAPVGITVGTTTLTEDGWGSVPRTYITCSRDVALLPAVQDRFIAEADAAFPHNPTSVAGLDSSHSPFLSMPRELAAVVRDL
ncbi:Pyrethroid hydrolase [Streptomyces sp. YIM 130001]|uniref:alpha/beta fold hydrolase n=1 Tax=Streptomyces sp. YIM 130001 TaxID=2259644 RepID=UPI000E65C85F|nr:alpha/beta fold hydrolase [Streptomyces sp. YIM 130001]RII15880.1 Pyrethroid hydrolase [Streptomyces sp. YIM 130001]